MQNQALRRQDGALYWEGVRLSALLQAGLTTPFYLYSEAELQRNWQRYEAATAGLDATIGYAVKANNNPVLLAQLARWGAGAIVVSEHELRHAIRCGFPTSRMLLHGNGKRQVDLDAALAAGVRLSADSEFDLQHIEARAAALGTRAEVLLRVNPDIDAQVHPYISTGLLDSKFGMPQRVLYALLPQLKALRHTHIRGLHCHLGSTLKSVQPVRDAAAVLLPLLQLLRTEGHPIDTLDLGGGLGIDYYRSATATPESDSQQAAPDLLSSLTPLFSELCQQGLRLWLEPGRSIVASAGALLSRVIGCKQSGAKNFLVTDASMAQLIRPCLYQAYHHIELLETPADSTQKTYDVVGPICESSDFLGLARQLPTPQEGDGLLIFDTGAYGFAMASRYNMHLLCAEYLISGETLRLIRRAETYEDLAQTFADQPVSI